MYESMGSMLTRRIDCGGRGAGAGITILVFAMFLWSSDAQPAAAPSMLLDAGSPTLATIGAQAGDILSPAVAPAQGPLPVPLASLGLADLGLTPGDVPVAMSFGTDAIPAGVLYFGVDRSASGVGGLFPPDVDSENASGVAGDIYRSFFPPNHTLVLDGNGQDGEIGRAHV